MDNTAPHYVAKSVMFIDGNRVTPGSEKCKCRGDCEMPCWQRIGIAEACDSCGCPPFKEAT